MNKPLLKRADKSDKKTYQIKVLDFTFINGVKFGMGFAVGGMIVTILTGLFGFLISLLLTAGSYYFGQVPL